MRRLVALTLALALVAACGGAGAGPAAPKTVNVDIQGFAFSAKTLEVAKGTMVVWTNRDGSPHTVTTADKKIDSGNIAPNGTFSYTFADAGTFDYACTIHPAMTATIVVR